MSIYGYGYGDNSGENLIDWNYYRNPPQQQQPGLQPRPLDYPAHLPWPPPASLGGGSSDGDSNNGPGPINQGVGSLPGREFDTKAAIGTIGGPLSALSGYGSYNAGNTIAGLGTTLLGIANPVVGLGLSYLGNQAWGDKYGKDGYWGDFSFWGDDKDKDGEKKDDGLGSNPLDIPGLDPANSPAGRGLTGIADLQSAAGPQGGKGYGVVDGVGVTDPDGDMYGYGTQTTTNTTFSPDNNYGYGGSQVDDNGNSNNYNGGGGDNYGYGDGDGQGPGGGPSEGTDAHDAASADAGEW